MALTAAMSTMALAPLVNAAQEMNRAQQRVSRYSTLRVCQDIGAFALGTFLAWQTGLGPAAPFAGLASVLALLAVVEGSRLWRESKGGEFRPAGEALSRLWCACCAGAGAQHRARCWRPFPHRALPRT
jgi:hypothetical protein